MPNTARLNAQSWVVLAHGFWDTGSVFNPMARDLEADGHRTLHPTLHPRDGRLGILDLAQKLACEIDTHVPPGNSIALVGFSMGTLVSRAYLQMLGGHSRVHTFFSISGPHQGTKTAFLYPGQATREMRPGSPFLEKLNADTTLLGNIRTFAYWTQSDFMIWPATSSVLPFAENIQISCWLHPLMVFNREVRSHIRRTLIANSNTPKNLCPSELNR